MGRIYGKSSTDFAVDAVRLAIADAGLEKSDIDGLLINAGITGFSGQGVSLQLQNALGMGNLRLLNHMNAAGSTAAQMVQFSTLMVSLTMLYGAFALWGTCLFHRRETSLCFTFACLGLPQIVAMYWFFFYFGAPGAAH